MINKITFEEYLQQDKDLVLFDVRTPAEFEKGHIPGAVNLPIFTNEERVEVGTTFKQVGREAAILLGFDLTGPKWRSYIEQALQITPGKKVCLHCWRGGMRSGVMAWVLDLFGFEVSLIQDGYKKYRNWVLQQFEKEYPLSVLGGMTGSRKTLILNIMKQKGAQVIDLEGLAKHQGSVYGSMNRMVQPSQEQFENNLADLLYHMNPDEKIWLEDESGRIGKIGIPRTFWQQMQSGTLIELQVSREQRVEFLVQEYGVLDKEFLIDATEHIQKRLGPEQTKKAIQAIKENMMEEFIQIILVYYDKTYKSCISKRDPKQSFSLEIKDNDLEKCADQIYDFARSIHH